jgi:hypothetical protein
LARVVLEQQVVRQQEEHLGLTLYFLLLLQLVVAVVALTELLAKMAVLLVAVDKAMEQVLEAAVQHLLLDKEIMVAQHL